MRYEDIQDSELRGWVESYQAKCLADRRSAKQGSEDLKAAWKHYSELDWWAFRELPDMRLKVRDFWAALPEMEPGAYEDVPWVPKAEFDDWLETVIMREIRSRRRSDSIYDEPYTLGLELEAISKRCDVPLPKKRKTVQVEDFNP